VSRDSQAALAELAVRESQEVVDLLDFLDQMEKMVNRVLMVYPEALDLPVYLDQRDKMVVPESLDDEANKVNRDLAAPLAPQAPQDSLELRGPQDRVDYKALKGIPARRGAQEKRGHLGVRETSGAWGMKAQWASKEIPDRKATRVLEAPLEQLARQEPRDPLDRSGQPDIRDNRAFPV